MSIFQSNDGLGLACEKCGARVSITVNTYVELFERLPEWTITVCPRCRAAREEARMDALPSHRTDAA